MADTTPVIGFVGLGDQGYPMAARIRSAGFSLAVHARECHVADGLVADGAVHVDSLAELGSVSDVLGVCVGDDADVVDVCDAVLPTMRPRSSTGSSRCIEMCVAGGGTDAFPRHSDGRRRGAELLAKDVDHFRAVIAGRDLEVPAELTRMVSSGIAWAFAAAADDEATRPTP